MGIVNVENFGLLLDPGLRKIFMDEFGAPGEVKDQLYGVEKSTKAVEYDYGIGGLSDLEEFQGTIQYGDFTGQYKTSYQHKEWCKGIKIERRLVDDDQYNVINKRPQAIALVTRRTREKHGANIFNNAFNTTTFAGGDGLALCASAHTHVGTATEQDNTTTSALSKTSLAAVRLQMRGFLDETDNLINCMGDTLLVPPELEQTAFEIINSQTEAYTADNTANFWKSRYKVIVWDYLSDTNNWFLIDSKYCKMFLKWFDRITPEFNKDKDFDTYVAKWSMYTRYSYGFSDWKFIIGGNVS
jgi:phage major head subunit gpT-like protein